MTGKNERDLEAAVNDERERATKPLFARIRELESKLATEEKMVAQLTLENKLKADWIGRIRHAFEELRVYHESGIVSSMRVDGRKRWEDLKAAMSNKKASSQPSHSKDQLPDAESETIAMLKKNLLSVKLRLVDEEPPAALHPDLCECGHPIKEHYSADRMYANCFHIFDDGNRCTCKAFKAKGKPAADPIIVKPRLADDEREQIKKAGQR